MTPIEQRELGKLKSIYESYGFEFAGTFSDEKILVFTIKNGYFDNADIVALTSDVNTDEIFNQFSRMKYACTVRFFSSLKQVEDQLFTGFFSVSTILDKLNSNYEKFTTALVKPFSEHAEYKYINVKYSINGKAGDTSPYDEVITRLDQDKPVLFLIEAAAGFGKTCTAYELVKKIIEGKKYLPFFSELSRNRKARIFRYILLDEIDRTFPILKSKLVQAEITSGRVITILDGFDELLHKNEDTSDFENSESMLETIGEYLTGNAKIVLTTRRTVLFEGDAFYDWVENHKEEFDLVTIKLSEPEVRDWIVPDRLAALEQTELDINNISNPVLLSYLRCIPDDLFTKVLLNPSSIVDSYFGFMLERERERQDLRIDIIKQQIILDDICEDMHKYGYTSEHREYIVDNILMKNIEIIEDSLSYYSTAEKPSKEEIANKLASHALLDRSTTESNKIGFINEFVLGHFVARNILKNKEWLSDDLRFIEPAVISYQPRTQLHKTQLLSALEQSLEFLNYSAKIDVNVRLSRHINYPLINGECESVYFNGVLIGEKEIENFQFNECTFLNCIFDISNIKNVTFLNSKFYDGKVIGVPSGNIYVLGSNGDSEFNSALNNILEKETDQNQEISSKEDDAEVYILEKFWPTGREGIAYKHRPIKGLCQATAQFKPNELFSAIDRLKRKNILVDPRNLQFAEINLAEIQNIRRILGKVAE